MKNHRIALWSLGAILVSCSIQEIDDGKSNIPVQYYASIEKTVEERTRVYANDQLHLRWDADDRISVFSKNTSNQEYRFTGQTGDNSGSFEAVSNGTLSGETVSGTYAVYPYRSSTEIDNTGILSMVLPAEQVYRNKSFGQGANTMVASTDDDTFVFKNACGYLMFKLYGKGLSVSSLSLRGNNGEYLAGKATVRISPGTDPIVEMIPSESTTKINLNCPSPVSLGSSPDDWTAFWFVLPPTVFSKGITLSISLTDGSYIEKSSSERISIIRNTRSRLSPLKVVSNAPTSISLNYRSVSMVAGDTFKLNATVNPSNAGNKTVQWSSNDPSIASVDENGLVTAIEQGNTTIVATTVNGLSAKCSISVSDYCYNGYVAVDLGLSVKWATKNVGASRTSDSGGYFAWGELSTKSVYDASTYKLGYINSSGILIMKYYNSSDGWKTLKPGDDVAHYRWGENWRMPTQQEYAELVKNCTWEEITVSGVMGIRFKSKINAKSIFFPYAGLKSGNKLYYTGSIYCWTSNKPNRGPGDDWDALCFVALLNNTVITNLANSRTDGLPVRPVHE